MNFPISRKWLLSVVLLLVSLFAVMVWAGHTPVPNWAGTNPVDFVLQIGSGSNSLLNTSMGLGKTVNISGTYNLTVVLRANATHLYEHIVNVSIMFYSKNFSFTPAGVPNFTMTNVSGEGCSSGAGPGWNCTNRTWWNRSLNTRTIGDGLYNLTIFIYNETNSTYEAGVDGVAFPLDILQNSTFAFNITVDNTPPNITSLRVNGTSINSSNYTRGGVIRLNATVNDSTTYVTNVTFGIRTIGGSLNNLTEFNVTTNRTDWVWFADVPLNTFSDGLYYVVVYANDTLNNLNGSNANFTAFVVDQTPPNVTNLRFGNYTTSGINFSNDLVGIALNTIITNLSVDVNDTTTYVVFVAFNISNSSGNITPEYTAFRNKTYWNASINSTPDAGRTININNLSSIPEGLYHITVLTNDSTGNRNNTVNFTFRIDRTAPSVSVSCGGPYTSGQTVTCTCTGSDTGGSLIQTGPRFSNGGSSQSTTATGSSGTSSGCEAIDYAGNVATATGTWTVSAASSGGGGSGGSGGGSSSGVSGQFAKGVWTSINANEAASIPITNGAIGVTEVSFAVEKTTYGAWVQVKKVDSLPSSVASFTAGEAYRKLDITQQNVQSVLKGEATIKFKVEKSWLAGKELSSAEVALYRYVDGKWTELSTTVGEDDGTYVHYAGTTPGFSYFVIGERAAAPVVEAPAEEAPAAPEEAAEAAAEVPAEEAPEAAAKLPVWLIPVIAALVIAALLYWYWKRK